MTVTGTAIFPFYRISTLKAAACHGSRYARLLVAPHPSEEDVDLIAVEAEFEKHAHLDKRLQLHRHRIEIEALRRIFS